MTLLLAGDLGGTKTLLALYEASGNQLTCVARERFISAEWANLGPMLKKFLSDQLQSGMSVEAGCIAVAGPVRNGKAVITNLDWNIDEKELASSCGQKLELVNDFAVLVYGLPHLSSEQEVLIQAGTPDPAGPIAIIGAGTGLGMARGIKFQGGLLSLPSEGGHREFAPRNADELLLVGWLRKELKLERLSLERIVSGTGLGLIYLWLEHCGGAEEQYFLSEAAKAWKELPPSDPGRPDLPALVATHAANGGPLASKAQEMWLGAYGSAAGDLAVHEMASGGLWVGGGTANKQLQGLQSEAFLGSMAKKGRFSEFVGNLPVKALVDSDAGLFSAACRARVLAECR